ncbi:MAG: helix-turn-helix domain-containing protein [Halobacteriales archaeon]
MQYVRLTAAPDLSAAPVVFRAIATSRHVTETRLLDWNVGGGSVVVSLFRIAGDRSSVEAALADAPEVNNVDCTPIDDDRFHALLWLDTDQVPMMRSLFDALLRMGIVVLKPVIYRDGEVHATFVGESQSLSTVLDAFPQPIDVTVHRIGTYRSGVESGAATLSDRQHEALLAALEVGYYEVPSEATHEDIAESLDCAPSTATEHIQKAESRLIRAVMGAGEN